MKKENLEKRMYSLAEVANILGISRIAVHKKIKNGQLRAQMVGNSYVIDSADIPFGDNLPQLVKDDIEKVVKKAVVEYGEAFKLLAKE